MKAADPTRRVDAPGSPQARALDLFAESLEQPENNREAWLRERCAGDAALCAAVLRLHAADVHGAGFLEASPVPLRDRIGERLGAFELVTLIGAGGMGRVYRARRADGKFEQEVAVKLFDAGRMDAVALARFDAERRILASLEHPGIARLIDGGNAADGTPYVVMELVRGEPVTRWCNSRQLDLAARLQLFVRLCEGLEQAHRRGIVHRDIKPGNVLVGEDGQPKLIDFGIAKVLQDSAVEVELPATAVNTAMLTPEYASPEQVCGRPVGPSSDVYSLGILLYELLTGVRPYQVATLSPAQLEQTVCRSVPADPSDQVSRNRASPPLGLADARQLRRALRGDIDRIVMTALCKEPGQRYPSAAALGRDIERYLSGEPVEARGASRLYRLRKFVQRHRGAAAGLATAFIVLIGGIVAVTMQAREAQRQRDAAQQEAARAEAARDFLVRMIGRADPFENADTPTLAGALKQSVQEIDERFSGQPALEAQMRHAIGHALVGLGETAAARDQLEQALALRRQHGSPLDQAESLDGLGVVAWWESDFALAEANLREALDQLDTDSSPRAQALRVNVLANLGGMLVDAGEYARSVAFSRQALAAAERSAQTGIETRASIWGNLGNALSELEGESEAALAAFDKVLALQREATGEMHPNYAIVLNNLGLMHMSLGRHDQALLALQRSLEIREQTLGGKHPQTATALFNLAGMLIALGRHAEAEPHALRALEVAERGFAPGHPRIGKAHEKLAQLYQATGRTELAREHARAALRLYRAAKGVDPAWIDTAQGVLDAL